MNPTGASTDANPVFTLDEITRLAESDSKPADTLMNLVALIAARFRTCGCCSRNLEASF